MSDLSNVLLINRADVMRITGLNGNIDEDKILPHVRTAQDIHLQTIIGTKLMEKCQTLVKDDQLGDPGNEAYAILVNQFITPMLVHQTMWDAIPFLQYEIANGGIFQHQSSNAVTPDDASVKMLIQKFKDKAEFYGNRLTGHVCDNAGVLPEWNESTTGAEIPGSGQPPFHGIVI